MSSTESVGRPPEERYDILGRIAVGGMAEIYLARDLDRDCEVALKRLMPGLQSDAEFVRMFYDEANIAARFRHPNIVTIHQLGELDGSLFISMELLKGVNLRELQARLHESGRTMPIGLGVRIAIDCLSALDYAHRFTDQYDRSLKVVHRDVSPQNIIVTYDGTTKIVDFGVSKAEGRLHQTKAGLIKGKFAYMSPEQISGGAVDGRSDLFALGEVLYELFLRRHPFYAQAEMDMLRGVLDDTPPHPGTIEPDFPESLSRTILRALQKMPEDRYGSAGLMKKDLEQFAASSNLPVNPGLLARFVQDLFRERIGQLEEARATGDLDAQVKAMRVVDAAPPPRPAVHSPQVAPDEPSRYARPGGRPPAVKVSAPSSGGFIAHSDAGRPAAAAKNRYEKSDVFDAPKLGTPTLRHIPRSLDDGEMPTVLGELSADDMKQLAKVRARLHKAADRVPDATVTPILAEEPTRRGTSSPERGGPGERADAAPLADRARPSKPGAPIIPKSGRSAVAPDPAETARRPASAADRLSIQPPDSASRLTPRSRTVVRQSRTSESPDRKGIVLFVVGATAFAAAIAYAAYMFWGAG